MSKKFILLSVLFAINGLLNLAALYYKIDTLTYITKPLITCVLVVIYISNVVKPNPWYILALFFAFLGDVILMLDDNYFIYGLISFFITHIFLIIIALKKVKKSSFFYWVIHVIPFLILLFGFVSLLGNDLGEMFYPVIAYGLIICTLGVIAFVGFNQNKNEESLLLLVGVIIFILSDSVLAINKFYYSDLYNQLLVMGSYMLALYTICRALIVKQQVNIKA